MARFLSLSLLVTALYSTDVYAQTSPPEQFPSTRMNQVENTYVDTTPTVAPTTVVPAPTPVYPVGVSSSSSSSGMSEYVYQGHVIRSFDDMKEVLDAKSLAPTTTNIYSHSSDSSAASSSSTDGDVVEYPLKVGVPCTPVVSKPAVITAPPTLSTPTVPTRTQPVVTFNPTVQQIQEKAELAAKAASAQAARTISGKQDEGFVTLAALITCCGLAAVVVIGVYMHRRGRGELSNHQGRVTTTCSFATSHRHHHPTITRRPSRVESVYDDPLGTRFSSIVMITPGGDGVCIL